MPSLDSENIDTGTSERNIGKLAIQRNIVAYRFAAETCIRLRCSSPPSSAHCSILKRWQAALTNTCLRAVRNVFKPRSGAVGRDKRR